MSDEFVTGEQTPISGGAEGISGGSSGEVPSTPAASGGTLSGTPQVTQVGSDLYEVKVNGKTLKVGLDELRSGYSRQQDYTRKAQELAQRERDWTARLGHYEKAIQETRALLSDRQKLAQILQSMPAGTDSAEEGDELLTRSQVDALRAKWFEEYEARQEQKAAAQRYQMEVEGLKSTYMSQLREVYDSMSEQFPALKKLPLFNEMRMKVGTFEPQSIEDAKALLANEIKELAKEQGWVSGAATVTSGAPSGIEPPGGVGMMPAEGERFSTVRDPRLRSAVLQDIEQLMRASLTT